MVTAPVTGNGRLRVRALRRFWVLAVIVAEATFAGLVVGISLLPNSYTSTSVVALVPRPDATSLGDLVRLSLPSYAFLATSDATAADLSGRFGADAERIGESIDVEIPPASNTLLLRATWSDPDTAAGMANALADVVRRAASEDRLLRATILAEALPPAKTSWPPRAAGFVAAGLLAVAAGALSAVVADRRRPLVASPTQVVGLLEEHGFSAPVLLLRNPNQRAAALVGAPLGARPGDGGGEGPARLLLLVLGEVHRGAVLLAAGVTARTARSAGHPLLLVSERGAPHLNEFTLPAAVRTEIGEVPYGTAGEPTAGRDELAVDVVVQVTESVKSLGDPWFDGRVLGVTPVVGADAQIRDVRAALRVLREWDVPVPAVCYFLPEPDGARSGPVTGGPYPPASGSPDATPEPDRAPFSPAGRDGSS